MVTEEVISCSANGRKTQNDRLEADSINFFGKLTYPK